MAIAKDKYNPHLLKMKNMLNIAKNNAPESIYNLSYEHILKHKDYIIKRNEEYFLTSDFEAEEFIGCIIDIIKDIYLTCSDREKDQIWSTLNALLRIILIAEINNINNKAGI